MQEHIKELLERYIKGECTEQERALLEKWFDRIAIDARGRLLNATEEERLVMEFWQTVGAREEKSDDAAGEAEEEPEAKVRRLFAIAAVWIGLIVVIGGIWLQWNKQTATRGVKRQPSFVEVVTKYQQVRKVFLPDSSTVWLNSATHLAFDSDFLNNREVHLSGEAFFDVRSDVRHPFVVKAGNGSTQVIQQAPGEMDVWTVGRLIFYDTPLKEALAQIEARYGFHILYDKPIKDGNITARFENTALEKVMARLSWGWDLHFVRKGDTIHVR